MFVRFSCGCIGLPQKYKGHYLIVSACNGEGDEIFELREMSEVRRGVLQDKTYEPLDEERVLSLIYEHDDILYRGAMALEAASLLRSIGEPLPVRRQSDAH